MAKMHPEDITGLDGVTEGEREVFRFLRHVARPDRDFTCWLRPDVGGLEPDLLLFSRTQGLLVLEVKDWALGQIRSADPGAFTIEAGSGTRTVTSPDKQARGYVHALMETIKKVPELLQTGPPHAGRLRVPVGRMCVFPNISFDELRTLRGLHELLPREKGLFREDLDPCGEIWADPSGRAFRERIAPAFPFPFGGLDPPATRKLVACVWPEFRIDLPARKGVCKARFASEVRGLDDAQARFARRVGRGHQILKGPPGSGKTIVLVHRCRYLLRYHPDMKRVLLLCFNIALASYLKRLVQEKGLGVGDPGVQVFHFFELASRLLDDPLQYDRRDADYYATATQLALEVARSEQHGLGTFDAVLVDEGQDFSDDMLRTALALLRPGGDLVVATDAFQDLYRRQSSWKALGIDARGRVHGFSRVYRNTAEIFDFSQRFLGQAPRRGTPTPLLPDAFDLHGEPPLLERLPDPGALEAFVAEDVGSRIAAGEYRRSEIAVLYDDKVYDSGSFRYAGKELPQRILRALGTAGIPVKWVSQDVRAKEMFDATSDSVSLVSIHSAKGLDFDLVYLLGADRIRATPATRDRLTALLYVAMTRAKHRLVIPYTEDSELVERMKACRTG